MLKSFVFICALFLFVNSTCQIPESFNYQAIARNAAGQEISNQTLGIKISVLEGSSSGTVKYSETFSVLTNDFGLFSIMIGKGTVVEGNFSIIDWSASEYFLKVDIDINGGTNYVELSNTQLLSVPYALYSSSANKLNINVTEGDMLYYSGDQWMTISKPEDKYYSYSFEWDFDLGKPYWKQEAQASKLPYLMVGSEKMYVHPTDNSSGIVWGSGFVTGTSYSDGELNTGLIVSYMGTGSEYAARVCAELEAYGYDDWYLPSNDEMLEIANNQDGLHPFTHISSSYWTSTEQNGLDARYVSVASATAGASKKSNSKGVRCVRKD